MKVIKAELESSHSIWLRGLEKKILTNFLKAQDLLITWRTRLLSPEFWNLTWLWTSFLLKICSLKIRFAVGQGTQNKLMSWVSSHVPKQYVDKGYPDCFGDGILLCALVEKLVSGACPRFDLLDPCQPLRNLKLATHLVEKHVKIRPPITAEEIFLNEKLAEKRLLLLLAQMKTASEMFGLSRRGPKSPHFRDFLCQTTFVSEKCFARGMGLLLAVRGRKACFSILLDSTENLDMVIEIRGPRHTACNRRIASALFGMSRRDSGDVQVQEETLGKKIPLRYRILGRQISVNYTPLESGIHHMSIIWQGQHIMGSPYTITVDNSSIESPDFWNGDPTGLASCGELAGSVIRRTILRYIVRIDGRDVVIDGKEDLCLAIKNMKKRRSWMSEDDATMGCARRVDMGEVLTDVPPRESVAEPTGSPDKEKAVVNRHPESEDCCCLKESAVMPPSASGSQRDRVAASSSRNVAGNFGNSYGIQSTIPDVVDATFPSCHADPSENCESETKAAKGIHNPLAPESCTARVKTNPKIVVSFQGEKFKEIRPDDGRVVDFVKDGTNAVNHENRCAQSTSDDDANFFPVHKVEYEMLHDDDDNDTAVEDCVDYNPKRRKSFTELNESNYLDEDAGELGGGNSSPDVETRGNFEGTGESEVGNCDARSFLRSNPDLFQCDHSLSFWTETVTETPPEFCPFERNERQSVHGNGSYTPSSVNGLHREVKCPVVHGGITTESSESSRIGGLDFEREGSLVTECEELEDNSDALNHVLYSSQCDELKNLNDDLNFIKNSLLKELPDNRKLSLWPDRDPLPPISESSIEGIMDQETCNDKLRNREIRDSNIKNSALNAVEIRGEVETQCPTSLSSKDQTSSGLEEIEAPGTRIACLADTSCPSSMGNTVNRLEIPKFNETEAPRTSIITDNSNSPISSEQHAADRVVIQTPDLDETGVPRTEESTSNSSKHDVDRLDQTPKVTKSEESRDCLTDTSCLPPLVNTADRAQIVKLNEIQTPRINPISEVDNSISLISSEPPDETGMSRGSLTCPTDKSNSISPKYTAGRLEQTPKLNENEICRESFTNLTGNSCPKALEHPLGRIQTSKLDGMESSRKLSACVTEKSYPGTLEHPSEGTLTLLSTESNSKTAKEPMGRTEESQKTVPDEDVSRSAFTSMNILSASPYKNKSSGKGETKFSIVTYLDKTQTNALDGSSRTSSSSQNASASYILTRATPVVIKENGDGSDEPRNETNISDNLSEVVDVGDSRETAQCLSVRKVIQIFQKEKEEPVDSWPTENSKSQLSFKKFKDDILGGEGDDDVKSEEPDPEHCLLFAPRAGPLRSSIRDRVKLFESDENGKSSEKKNEVEKRVSSSIRVKKMYWENITS